MELRHLRYFVAVARELHVTRAASSLGIAQPALTLQIKALERELGVELFDRAGRRMALTAAGRSFQCEAEAILEQVARVTAKTRRIAEGLAGRLRVGFTESASFNPIVTGAIRSFRTAYPEVDLELEEKPSTRLAAAIRAEELDIAFVRPPVSDTQGIELETLAQEAMLAAVPMDHPLAGLDVLSMADLAEERFILYPRAVGPGLSDEIVRACQDAGFSPIVVQQTPQLSSTVNLVAAGLGVSIVPACLQQVRTQAVRFAQIIDLPLKARLGLICRARDPSPTVANFRRQTASVMDELIGAHGIEAAR